MIDKGQNWNCSIIEKKYILEIQLGFPNMSLNNFNTTKSLPHHNQSFQTIVDYISKFIKEFSKICKYNETLTPLIIKKFDIFSALGEIKNINNINNQIKKLATYLLCNQITFYHIYHTKTENHALQDLSSIKSFENLREFFKTMFNLNYDIIYGIDIVDHIINKDITFNKIINLITTIKEIEIELFTQDLLGRFFQDLIPHEVRKILAAFYTNPIAADLLSSLCIIRSEDSVFDPACGSGTLLLSAYNRKKALILDKKDLENKNQMHKRFIQSEITGIDIMPFASHISSINLTSQNFESQIDIIRIATMDSLTLPTLIQENKIKIHEKTNSIFNQTRLSVNEGKKSFTLDSVDCVIMNPPFTDRVKMPFDMRKNLNNNSILGQICGHKVNLWGYFMALADLFVKSGGKIGAVIPISFVRGKATEKIRKYILENYYIEYIIKPVSDVAFSESSNFRDIILILIKQKPSKNNLTKVIFLTEPIKNLSQNKILQVTNKSNPYSIIREVSCNELLKNSDNLMKFLMPEEIDSLLQLTINKSNLITLNTNNFDIGLTFRPRGVGNGVFITRKLSNSRIKNALAIIKFEDNDSITIQVKGNDDIFKLSKKFLGVSFRTTTGITSMEIDKNNLDYIIIRKNDVYHKFLLKYTKKIPKPFPWNKHLNSNILKSVCFLVFPRKLRMDSKNTHHIAFLSEERIKGAGPSLYCYYSSNLEEMKILCLFFNSIISMFQIILLKSETLGAGWFELMKSDWSLFRILDFKKLPTNERLILITCFDEVKKLKFPSIKDQLKDEFHGRIKIDTIILRIMGLNEKETKELIPKMYKLLLKELA